MTLKGILCLGKAMKIVMQVTEMSQAKDVKNKTQHVANTLD